MLEIGVLLTVPAKALDSQKLITQFTHTSWTAKDGIPGPVRAIAQTPEGYLWLGTEVGLHRFDGLRFVAWEPSFGERIPSSSVWSLYTARDGSLWIGFSSAGIGQLHNGHMTTYSQADDVPPGGILSIVEDANGAIWAGGPYGLSKLENGKWSRVGAEEGYPAPGAQTMLVDHSGKLWVATDHFNFGLSSDSVNTNTILTLDPNAKNFTATGQPEVWRSVETLIESYEESASFLVSKQLVDRFRAERQILANLNHPNVARLIDGGTTPQGLPVTAPVFAPVGTVAVM